VKLLVKRLDARSLIVVLLVLTVVAALLYGFDVINGGYTQADIPIGL
jgi:preprotein translocase subunit SecE